LQDKDKIRMVSIIKTIDESKYVKTLIFNDKFSSKAEPGQFLMVWNPDNDELPMSIMLTEDTNKAAISIKRRGEASTALYNKREGDVIGIRGPYGKGFTIKQGNLLLVGGGTGLVPLLRLCKYIKNSKITLIMGFNDKEEVMYEDLARSIIEDGKIIITTNDGSYGIKGFATDPIERLLSNERVDMIYTCGPELMMKKVLTLAIKYNIDIEVCLERIMKCGIGLCSSCSINKYLVCKDGPVLNGKDILYSEFGKCYRDKSGRLVNY